MKLLAIFACVSLAALAQAEIHWDKSGQYRLVDTAPFYYAPARAYVPFIYSYKQVDSKKTPEESMPSIVEVMPSMPEFLPTIAEVMPSIAEVTPEIAEVSTSTTTESLPIVSEPIEE